jgi:hypothetical protein
VCLIVRGGSIVVNGKRKFVLCGNTRVVEGEWWVVLIFVEADYACTAPNCDSMCQEPRANGSEKV